MDDCNPSESRAFQDCEYDGDMGTKRFSRPRNADEERLDSELLQQFVPLVEFLGKVLGSRSEVVLHDASNADKSVIAIANSEVSGRNIGAPSTDFMLKLMQNGTEQGKDYVVGYEGRTTLNKHALVSSTYLIRRKKRVIGALCINTDQTPFLKLEHALEEVGGSYLFAAQDETSRLPEEENLITSIEDIATEVIAEASSKAGTEVESFGLEQRLAVISQLNERGYFNFKGSVAKVAKQLGISVSTMYRYLQMLDDKE